VEVDPARLQRWLDNFAERHGSIAVDTDVDGLRVRAFDGTMAFLHTPPGTPPTLDLPAFVAAAGSPRAVGLLLVRRGGYAVGVAEAGELVASKVDSTYVQARTAAGGWSQQRFARRRENQTRALVNSAVETAVRVLLPEATRLATLVTGGDRALVDQVLADRRLGILAGLRAERFLDVPDPRLAVLREAVGRAHAVRVRVVEDADALT
jgi:hypothetical protein